MSHHGECDIDRKGTEQTPGSQQPGSGANDHGPSGGGDGSNPAPRPAHPGGLPAAPTQYSRAVDEPGIQMIFAQSPQAKGRVKRTAGTFQDRLIAELRLAGATTPEQAQAVLGEFVLRFNRRFGIPPQCSATAFRPLDPELCLEQVLCFEYRQKVDRDNTVRLQLRTLQLLPASERPSYAGAAVEVLEGLDGQLSVRHEGASSPLKRPRQVRYSFATATGLPPSLRLCPSG